MLTSLSSEPKIIVAPSLFFIAILFSLVIFPILFSSFDESIILNVPLFSIVHILYKLLLIVFPFKSKVIFCPEYTLHVSSVSLNNCIVAFVPSFKHCSIASWTLGYITFVSTILAIPSVILHFSTCCVLFEALSVAITHKYQSPNSVTFFVISSSVTSFQSSPVGSTSLLDDQPYFWLASWLPPSSFTLTCIFIVAVPSFSILSPVFFNIIFGVSLSIFFTVYFSVTSLFPFFASAIIWVLLDIALSTLFSVTVFSASPDNL